MSSLDVSVVLRLIDELTGPARKAADSITDMQKRLVELSRKGSTAADNLPKDLLKAAEAAKLTGQQIQGLAQRYENVTRAIRGMKAADGLAVRSNWIKVQTTELDGLAAAAKRAEKAKQAVYRDSGVVGAGVKALGGFALASKAKDMAKTGFEQAFSTHQTSAILQAQGESLETINRAMALSRTMAAENTQFTSAQHLQAMAELRPAMIGGFEEAMKLAPDFQKAVGVLETIKSHGGGLKGIDSKGEALDLARFLEIKGVTKDGEEAIHGYMNSLTKAIVSFNGQLTASDFHQTAKMGRGATRGWSQEFVEQFLPTLMNDLKTKGGTATGAGNALASFGRTIVDRVMKGSAAEAFFNMGLVERGKVLRNSKGRITGVAEGGIKNWQLAMANPYKWMQQELIPAMIKENGGKMPGEEKILSRMGALFGNRVAQAIANIMAVQKEQIEKDAQNTIHAMGLSANQFLANNSPVAQMQSFAAAFKDMAGAFASPMAGPALRAMRGLADMMRSTTDGVSGSKDFNSFGGKLDRLIEGLFQQRYGKTGGVNDPNSLTPGDSLEPDKIYNFGTRLHDAFGKLGESVSFWATEIGDRWGRAANFVTDPIKSTGEAIAAAAEGIKAASDWISSYLPEWAKPKKGPKVTQGDGTGSYPGMMDPNTTVTPGGRKSWNQDGKKAPDYTLGNGSNKFRNYSTWTENGIGDVPARVTEQLKNLPSAMVPDLSDIGTRAMQSLATGMQKSAGLVTGQMTALMGTLQSIAAGGVNIPVHLDSGGVSGAVQGAIQKASISAKSGSTIHNTFNVHGSDPDAVARKVHARFSSSVSDHLNDVG
jgi:hypothetical protein